VSGTEANASPALENAIPASHSRVSQANWFFRNAYSSALAAACRDRHGVQRQLP